MNFTISESDFVDEHNLLPQHVLFMFRFKLWRLCGVGSAVDALFTSSTSSPALTYEQFAMQLARFESFCDAEIAVLWQVCGGPEFSKLDPVKLSLYYACGGDHRAAWSHVCSFKGMGVGFVTYDTISTMASRSFGLDASRFNDTLRRAGESMNPQGRPGAFGFGASAFGAAGGQGMGFGGMAQGGFGGMGQGGFGGQGFGLVGGNVVSQEAFAMAFYLTPEESQVCCPIEKLGMLLDAMDPALLSSLSSFASYASQLLGSNQILPGSNQILPGSNQLQGPGQVGVSSVDSGGLPTGFTSPEALHGVLQRYVTSSNSRSIYYLLSAVSGESNRNSSTGQTGNSPRLGAIREGGFGYPGSGPAGAMSGAMPGHTGAMAGAIAMAGMDMYGSRNTGVMYGVSSQLLLTYAWGNLPGQRLLACLCISSARGEKIQKPNELVSVGKAGKAAAAMGVSEFAVPASQFASVVAWCCETYSVDDGSSKQGSGDQASGSGAPGASGKAQSSTFSGGLFAAFTGKNTGGGNSPSSKQGQTTGQAAGQQAGGQQSGGVQGESAGLVSVSRISQMVQETYERAEFLLNCMYVHSMRVNVALGGEDPSQTISCNSAWGVQTLSVGSIAKSVMDSVLTGEDRALLDDIAKRNGEDTSTSLPVLTEVGLVLSKVPQYSPLSTLASPLTLASSTVGSFPSLFLMFRDSVCLLGVLGNTDIVGLRAVVAHVVSVCAGSTLVEGAGLKLGSPEYMQQLCLVAQSQLSDMCSSAKALCIYSPTPKVIHETSTLFVIRTKQGALAASAEAEAAAAAMAAAAAGASGPSRAQLNAGSDSNDPNSTAPKRSSGRTRTVAILDRSRTSALGEASAGPGDGFPNEQQVQTNDLAPPASKSFFSGFGKSKAAGLASGEGSSGQPGPASLPDRLARFPIYDKSLSTAGMPVKSLIYSSRQSACDPLLMEIARQWYSESASSVGLSRDNSPNSKERDSSSKERDSSSQLSNPLRSFAALRMPKTAPLPSSSSSSAGKGSLTGLDNRRPELSRQSALVQARLDAYLKESYYKNMVVFELGLIEAVGVEPVAIYEKSSTGGESRVQFDDSNNNTGEVDDVVEVRVKKCKIVKREIFVSLLGYVSDMSNETVGSGSTSGSARSEVYLSPVSMLPVTGSSAHSGPDSESDLVEWQVDPSARNLVLIYNSPNDYSVEVSPCDESNSTNSKTQSGSDKLPELPASSSWVRAAGCLDEGMTSKPNSPTSKAEAVPSRPDSSNQASQNQASQEVVAPATPSFKSERKVVRAAQGELRKEDSVLSLDFVVTVAGGSKYLVGQSRVKLVDLVEMSGDRTLPIGLTRGLMQYADVGDASIFLSDPAVSSRPSVISNLQTLTAGPSTEPGLDIASDEPRASLKETFELPLAGRAALVPVLDFAVKKERRASFFGGKKSQGPPESQIKVKVSVYASPSDDKSKSLVSGSQGSTKTASAPHSLNASSPHTLNASLGGISTASTKYFTETVPVPIQSLVRALPPGVAFVGPKTFLSFIGYLRRRVLTSLGYSHDEGRIGLPPAAVLESEMFSDSTIRSFLDIAEDHDLQSLIFKVCSAGPVDSKTEKTLEQLAVMLFAVPPNRRAAVIDEMLSSGSVIGPSYRKREKTDQNKHKDMQTDMFRWATKNGVFGAAGKALSVEDFCVPFRSDQ